MSTINLKKEFIDVLELVNCLANDLGLDELSLNYVRSRLANEGVSFLTKSLPELSKAVLAGLETGRIKLPTCFARSKRTFSRYFQVWLTHIFDRDGYVKDNPCATSIKKIRQFCDYLYKLALPFDKKSEEAAYKKVQEIEAENKTRSSAVSYAWLDKLKKLFNSKYQSLANSNILDVLESNRPRYTSGAFFGSEKIKLPVTAYKSMPSSIIGLCSPEFKSISGYFRSYVNRHEQVAYVREGKVSKTLLVPKDSRGPRLISKEPLHLLKLQMSYFDYMVKTLEKVSRNRINFLDQNINRGLALESSLSRQNCTLDLKDASDRVLFTVCNYIFGDSPFIRWFLNNVRSTETIVNGIKIPLYKLSGMGSGLTFPTMALLIHLSVCASVIDRTGLPYAKVAPRIYVYGDDIICPRAWYAYAVEGLRSSGLEVNISKSFSESHFRESCGGDYYKGINVTPVRLKLSNSGVMYNRPRSKPTGYLWFKNSDHGYYQLDRHCRELVKAGLISVASYFYDLLERKLPGYGYTSGDSSTLGRYSVDPIYINDDFIHRRWVAKSAVIEFKQACPYKYLAQCLTSAGNDDKRLAYGEIAMPRKVNLVKKAVRSIHLR